eukprot:scaffold60448_cov47-Phaeocystis_antarctica.AAC.1
MALSKLSADEAGIILGQLLNPLEPRLAVYFSSASSGLRVLLTPALRQQLRADHEVATALCLKMGMRSCKELREAKDFVWEDKLLSAADLTTLGTLGSVLPALEYLLFHLEYGPGGVVWLMAGLGAGALPAVTWLQITGEHVIDASASALAAALGRGAVPRLKDLFLTNTTISDAGLVALAPTLRRLPALERLYLEGSPFGDEGLQALVAAPSPAGAPQTTTAVFKKLQELHFSYTEITDAGCAALASALDRGVLPALGTVDVGYTPTSAAAKATLKEALVRSKWRADDQLPYDDNSEYGHYHRCGRGCGCCGGCEEDTCTLRYADELEGESDTGDGAGWSSVLSISGAVFDLSTLDVTVAQARKIAPLLCANAELRAIRCEGGELSVSDLREEEELEWDSEEIRDVEVRAPTLLVEAIIIWC